MKMLYTRVVTKEEIHQYNSKERTRNIIWFNPPFSQTVKTNIVKYSSDYILWINIFQSLTHYARSLTGTQSELVRVA